MNRRKTIKRPSGLTRLFGRPRNRRISAAQSAVEPRTKGSGGSEQRRSKGASEQARGLRLDRLTAGLAAAAQRGLAITLAVLKVAAVAALLAVVGIGGYIAYQRVVTTTYFDIETVEIVGARQAPVQELSRVAATIKGHNVFSADLERVRRSMVGHPWVKEAKVQRVLPHTVRVTVVEHRATALLLMGHLYLVSAGGKVFKRAEPEEQEGLPVVTGITRMAYLNQPAATSARLGKALAALERYYDRVRPPLSEVHVGDEGAITLYMKQGGAAVHMGEELTDQRLNKLDAVWAALGPDVRRARVVFLDNEARADRVTVRMGRYE